MLYYITSNKAKIRVASRFLSPLNVEIEGKQLDLVEIQSDNIEEIARDKARQAYAAINEPLFVNDAGWYITALNGFPGPFMKYVNQWLTADDMLRMMSGHANREVIFKEVVCYVDKNQLKSFVGEIKGKVLDKGTDPNAILSASIITLSSSGRSIAESWQQKVPSVDNYDIWQKFADWYSNNI